MDFTEPHEIPVEFFTKRGRKTTQLVGNRDEAHFVYSQNKTFELELENPIFVESIELLLEGFSEINDVEFGYVKVAGQIIKDKKRIVADIAYFEIGHVVEKLLFRPDAKLFRSAKIKSIKVVGLSIDELTSYSSVANDLSLAQTELVKLQGDRESKTNEVNSLSSESKELKEKIASSRAELESIYSSREMAQTSLGDTRSSLEEVRANLARERAERTKVSSELKDLKEELKIFPSQIAGFVRTGNKNITSYLAMALPFAGVLVLVMCSLFDNAIELSNLWEKSAEIDVWNIFITRLPFLFVALALIETCGFIVGRFVFEIVRINRQRLELEKLSLIAKDVTSTCAKSTSLTDDEVYEKELVLKMQMLREHMKGFSGSEFEYRGGAIVSTILNVADRIAGKTSAKSIIPEDASS